MSEYRTKFADRAARDRSYVTSEIWDELERFVDGGIPTSQFIRYVLLGDLHGAAMQASEVNSAILVWVSRFVVRTVPHNARGTHEKIDAWRGYNSMVADDAREITP